LENVPRKRPYTVIEALLSIDMDMARGGLKSVLAYSRIFGHSRNWCRTRIGQYMDTQDDLKIRGKSVPTDRAGTPDGHHLDTRWTPTLDPDPDPDPEKKEKESAADAAPFVLTGGNGKVKKEKKARRGKKPTVPFPDPFPDADRQRVYRLAAGSFTPQVCDYAIESTRLYAVPNQKVTADWPLTVWGYMRKGWVLPKPGSAPFETPEQRYARMAKEMEEENAEPR
jgi:hypothetical protein